MNTSHQCCQVTARNSDLRPRSEALQRRAGKFAGWFLPSTVLILLPKCPVCVAAYVALFSGVSLSMAAASNLRLTVLILCVSVLVLRIAKCVRGLAFRNK